MPRKRVEVALGLSDAPVVNRAAVILLPTNAYFEWTKTCPGANPAITLAHVREDPTVFLIPGADTPATWVDDNYLDLFEHELEGWSTNEAVWPQNRTRELFHEYFEAHIGTMVLDMVEGPVAKE